MTRGSALVWVSMTPAENDMTWWKQQPEKTKVGLGCRKVDQLLRTYFLGTAAAEVAVDCCCVCGGSRYYSSTKVVEVLGTGRVDMTRLEMTSKT